jgi:hypothetical protein
LESLARADVGFVALDQMVCIRGLRTEDELLARLERQGFDFKSLVDRPFGPAGGIRGKRPLLGGLVVEVDIVRGSCFEIVLAYV